MTCMLISWTFIYVMMSLIQLYITMEAIDCDVDCNIYHEQFLDFYSNTFHIYPNLITQSLLCQNYFTFWDKL